MRSPFSFEIVRASSAFASAVMFNSLAIASGLNGGPSHPASRARRTSARAFRSIGPVEVDDTGIQAMCRIEFAEHGAVQPLVGSDGAECRATEYGRFPLGHLDPHAAANAHGVLPRAASR